MRTFLWIALLYFAGFFAHAILLGKTVYGDGVYYYAWLTALAPSKYAIGPALFWAPSYIMTGFGSEFIRQLAVGFTSVSLALVGLLMLWRMLQKQYSQTVSIMTVAAIAGATNLLFYGSVDPVNSHALSFFATVFYLALLLSKRKNWFAIGISLGLIGLIRPQDLVYGLLLPSLQPLIVAGFAITFFPQLVAWGGVISPYLTGSEGFDFLHPHFLGVVFNLKNGLFVWTPITILGVVGLVIKKHYRYLAVFVLTLYVTASWSTWWQGASYSARMLTSSLPVLAFGIAHVFSLLEKLGWKQSYYLLAVILPLSGINALGIVYFLITLT